jgi:hypothetical protein
MFSTLEMRKDPDNHCVPLLDIIDLSENKNHASDRKLLVMPLYRRFDDPSFQTYGEFVAFFTQICKVGLYPLSQINSDDFVTQGLRFMHQRNVALR